MPLNTPYLKAVDHSLENIKLIHSWRNHPQTLENSFNSLPKSFEIFKNEYLNKYHSIQSLPPLFIIYENQKVGIIYFEKWFKELSIEISLFLDPKYLNQRMGRKAIEQVTQEVFQKGFEEVIALVKPENIGAQKAFEYAGFSLLEEVTVPKYNTFFPAKKYHSLKQKKKQTSTFIIGEVGSNFSLGDEEKSLSLAKTMIEEAYIAGCDAVKFQLFNSTGIYVPNAGEAGYLKEDINKIFEKYALPKSFVPKLYDHAKYVGIEFMCSFFSKEDFEVINPYVQKHKIASYEIRHLRLLQLAAKSQKPLFLSTGASDEEDIKWAVETFFSHGGKELTLLHCTAKYPAESDSLNLNCIKTLQEKFKLPVGLSDHSSHPIYAPIAAIALGATTLEKHFTLNPKFPGPDHFFSIDSKELKEMCLAIRETEKILGLAKKEIFPQEGELAAFARRGLQAILPIRAGDLLKEDLNISILRPGKNRLGIHPKYAEQLEGKKAAQDIPLGCGIQLDDVIW